MSCIYAGAETTTAKNKCLQMGIKLFILVHSIWRWVSSAADDKIKQSEKAKKHSELKMTLTDTKIKWKINDLKVSCECVCADMCTECKGFLRCSRNLSALYADVNEKSIVFGTKPQYVTRLNWFVVQPATCSRPQPAIEVY